jgi:polyhydroxyalkanoate synthesis regulator phasin
MVDALRKVLMAGLGTIDLTEEKAKALFNDLVARGEMSESDARELIAGWSKRASEQRGRLQQDVESAVNRAMAAMGLARRTDVETLNARVAELERKLAAPGETSGQPSAPGDATK